jgi:hypothetical protein
VIGVVAINSARIDPRARAYGSLNYSPFLFFFPLGSWVIGANVGRKLFIALQLEVARHFIERCAGGRTRRFEPPATFGAAKTPKTLFLNPYQLPAHGRLCCCSPTSTCLLSTDEAFWFAINGPLRSCVPPKLQQKPSPGLGVAKDA